MGGRRPGVPGVQPRVSETVAGTVACVLALSLSLGTRDSAPLCRLRCGLCGRKWALEEDVRSEMGH